MAFASKTNSKKTNNLPDKELVIKVNTSEGYVTLGRIGLYDESPLHSKVTQLSNEQLAKLLASAQLTIIEYSRTPNNDIKLVF